MKKPQQPSKKKASLEDFEAAVIKGAESVVDAMERIERVSIGVGMRLKRMKERLRALQGGRR